MGIFDRFNKKSKNENKENTLKKGNVVSENNEKYKSLYENYIQYATEIKDKYEKAGIECNIVFPKSFDDFCSNRDFFIEEQIYTLPKLEEQLEVKIKEKKSDSKSSGYSSNYSYNSGNNQLLRNAVDDYYDGVNQAMNEGVKKLSDSGYFATDDFDAMMNEISELEKYSEKVNSEKRR